MKLRTGLVAGGVAVGYYLGAKAGRQRYEQMSRLLRRAGRSSALGTAAGKARAVVDLGVERTRDLLGIGMDDEVRLGEITDGTPLVARSNRQNGKSPRTSDRSVSDRPETDDRPRYY